LIYTTNNEFNPGNTEQKTDASNAATLNAASTQWKRRFTLTAQAKSSSRQWRHWVTSFSWKSLSIAHTLPLAILYHWAIGLYFNIGSKNAESAEKSLWSQRSKSAYL